MHAAISRAVKNASSIRSFSAALVRNSARPLKLIDDFSKSSRNPVWMLVKNISVNGDPSEALKAANISRESFDKTKQVLAIPDLSRAVAALRRLGYLTSEGKNANEGQPIPSWILLYLVAYRVRLSLHAQGRMIDLVFSHLNHVHVDLQGPLLILAAYHLCRFNLLLPMRRVLDTFLTTPFHDHAQERLFNAFLQTLSLIHHRSAENANSVIAVLTAMDKRKLKLHSQTYDTLLNDEFVTFQLAKFLLVRMARDGFHPTVTQLELFMRIFASHGAMEDAEKYLVAIHGMTDSPQNDHTKSPRENENDPVIDKDPKSGATTLLLNSFRKRSEAFAFLRRLVKEEDAKLPLPQPLPQTSQPLQIIPKIRNDMYDHTATFHVAARDKSYSGYQLVSLFKKLPDPPDIVTYTILIRGLLFRKEFTLAEEYWLELYDSDFALDTEALTAGLQTLTRVGKANEAFQLIETYAQRPGEEDSADERITPIAKNQLKLVYITTISMNEFMVSLKRMGRPDVVFRLWDHMHVLYGTYPNDTTLSILLQSARQAHNLDDSLSGVLAKIKLYSPFKYVQKSMTVDRESAVNSILTVVGHPSKRGIRQYSSGVWRDLEPAEFGRKVFLQALFGNDPERRLWSVESPVGATRQSYDSDDASGITLLPIHDLAPKKYVFVPFDDLLTPDGKSHYPHIVVTNLTCFNYITLLGVCGRANEIPLVMAWMKELGLQPSHSTTAIAMAFWSEISTQAPLVEKLSGGEENNEYTKFVRWLRDWLGDNRIPNDRLLGKWMLVIRTMRRPQQ